MVSSSDDTTQNAETWTALAWLYQQTDAVLGHTV